MIQKTKWRSYFLTTRRALSPSRRTQASRDLREVLMNFGPFLSFASFQSEIDTSLLNQALASEGRLFLPRVEGDSLAPYQVSAPEKQLIRSAWGILEPDPSLCPKVLFSELHSILVPGLGFDRKLFRLGYGKGFYDRLLAATHLPAIGVGFKEQLIEDSLPIDPWDKPVDNLLLF